MTDKKRELRIDLPEPTNARDMSVTTARLGVGRAGTRPTTAESLRFDADHAVTQDAIYAAVDPDLLLEMDLLAVNSLATSREEFLLRPDFGRKLSPAATTTLRDELTPNPDVQLFVGDGLSAAAVEHNLPVLLPGLTLALQDVGLTVGRPFFVHNARVGLLNAVNAIVGARVCAVLIGERPGLARAESMSIYIGFRPNDSHTDAQRNVISNIYANGLPPQTAILQAVDLIQRMLQQETSGVALG